MVTNKISVGNFVGGRDVVLVNEVSGICAFDIFSKALGESTEFII